MPKKKKSDEDVFQLWFDENPLRIWRKRNKLGLFQAAARIGVTMKTIQAWELGTSTPNDENFGKIADTVKITESSLRQRWNRWRQIRPE